jgi:hypothetical protein
VSSRVAQNTAVTRVQNCAAGLLSAASRSSASRIKSAATSSCTCAAPPAQPYGVVYNIAKSGFYNLSSGITVGDIIQGVTVRQSNFAKGVTGIFVPVNATGVTEITVSGSTFNCTGNQILMDSPVASIIMNGNLINVSANNAGVWFDLAPSSLNPCGGGGFGQSFVNNIFTGSSATGPSGTGILNSFPAGPPKCGPNTPTGEQGAVAYSEALGNVFSNLAAGVDLTDAVYWNVQANSYTGVTTQVPNSGVYAVFNSVGKASP